MLLTPEQINELLTIINRNQALLIAEKFGFEFLSEYDKSLLEANGVKWEELYTPENDSIYTSFHLGMLAQALNDTKALTKLDYQTLKNYVKQGAYIPITQREQSVVNSIKNQTLSDIRSLNGKIFQDVNGILTNQSRKSQEEFIRKELEQGVINKKSSKEVASDIATKTGDWNRNFERIVSYQVNSAYQQGRASFIESTFEDPLVYKRVFVTGCKECLRLYTTKGYLTEPRLFKLVDLKANGTNIGRKTIDWKPVIDSTHPHCYCQLHYKRKGYKWNTKTQDFDILDLEKEPILKKKRELIRVKIGDKEIFV